MSRSSLHALVVALAFISTLACAQEISPQLVQLAPGLSSLQGTHADSGTEYLRLLLTAASPTQPANAPQLEPPPTFTIECTQLHNRRTLSFYVNFGGVEDISFPPPFKKTQTNLFPPQNPSVFLQMTFEGYIHSKPFKRSWEQLPNGNYKYRNPGIDSKNLDGPRYFLQYLNSLPGLHLVHPAPEPGKPADLVFQTSALLQQVARAPLCQP